MAARAAQQLGWVVAAYQWSARLETYFQQDTVARCDMCVGIACGSVLNAVFAAGPPRVAGATACGPIGAMLLFIPP